MGKNEIEQLLGTVNYNPWQRTMVFNLKRKGLWEITLKDPNLNPPDKTDNAAFPDYPNEPSKKKYKAAKLKYQTYKEKQADAMYRIFSAVAEVHRSVIENAETPEEMMKLLDSAFNAKTDGRGLSADALRDALQAMRYEFGSGIDDFMSKFTEKVNLLRSVEKEVKDGEIINKLQNAMPPEARHLKSVLRIFRQTDEGQIWTNIMEKYRTEMLELERDAANDEAFSTAQKTNKAKPKRPAKKYCHHCSKPGHKDEDCWIKYPSKKKDKEKSDSLKPPATPKKRPSKNDLRDDKVKKSKRATSVSELGLMAQVCEVESDDEEEVFVHAAKRPHSQIDWYCDSAATRHMASNRTYFVHLRPLDITTFVKVGNGARIKATAIGDIVLNLHIKEAGHYRIQPSKVKDVLFVPDLMVNLLSIRQLAEKGISTNFAGKKASEPGPLRAQFVKNGSVLATAKLRNGQYVLDLGYPKTFRHQALVAEPLTTKTLELNVEALTVKDTSDDSDESMPDASETSDDDSEEFLTESEDDNSSDTEDALANEYEETEARLSQKIPATQFQNLWHHRLGHPNENVMRQLSYISDIKDKEALRTCRLGRTNCLSCAEGKSCKTAHTVKSMATRHQDAERSSELLDIIHIDTSGKIQPASFPDRFQYFQLYIEDSTSFTTIAFLKQKSDGFSKLKAFKGRVETQTGLKIKRVKTDQGTEFISGHGKQFFTTHGIIHELSPIYNPMMNGKAERGMRTITGRALSMMFTAGAPSYLWDKAFAYANYVTNRLPSNQNYGNVSPFFAWNGFHPHLRQLRVWGCNAYVHIPKEKRTKLQKTAVKGAFVGMEGEDNAIYKIWIPSTKTIVISADVMFDEFNFDVISKNSGVVPNGLHKVLNQPMGALKRKSIYPILRLKRSSIPFPQEKISVALEMIKR